MAMLKYKKPRAINSVSVMLVILFLLAVYAGYCLWPAYIVGSRAKGILLDNLPTLYRANLRGGNVAFEMIQGMKKTIPEALRAAGVRDPDLALVFERNKKFVALQAKFKIAVHFVWIDKYYSYPMSPRVETDAARVEW